MQYQLEITDELAVTIDLPPGAPAPTEVNLEFEASTEDELRELVPMLGFDPRHLEPRQTIQFRWDLPLMRDGERVARGSVHLHLRGDLALPERREVLAVQRLKQEAEQRYLEQQERVREDQAVAWAQSVGRPVTLKDGEIVEDPNAAV